MAALTHGGTGVEALNRNAPSSTPGTARRPHSSTAASAIPLGGHTGAMLVCTNASANAALPAARYTPASSAVLASATAQVRSAGRATGRSGKAIDLASISRPPQDPCPATRTLPFGPCREETRHQEPPARAL
jgi:hypothetical protein